MDLQSSEMPEGVERVRFRDAAVSATKRVALFIGVYFFTNWHASTLDTVPSAYFEWERALPFVPWMIVPYMTIDVFFVLSFFFCATRAELRQLERHTMWAITSSAFFFLLLPLKVAFEKPETAGFPGFLFDILRIDAPFNQFPSLHISLAVILLPVYLRRRPAWVRAFVATWFALIVISTLLVYQHHAIDICGGVAVALSAFLLFPAGRPIRPGTHPEIGLRYALASLFFTAVAVRWPPYTVWAAWPAVSCAIVASGYLGLGARVLGKRNGLRSWLQRVVLGPYLLGAELAHQFLRNRVSERVEISSGIWLGRRLSRTEAPRLIQDGVGAVVDLAAEFPRRPELHRLNVFELNLLDFTSPSSCDLAECIEFIERHRSRGVLVHCSLGCTRGALVAAAWVLNENPNLGVRGAIERVRSVRPQIRLGEEGVRLLAEFSRGPP